MRYLGLVLMTGLFFLPLCFLNAQESRAVPFRQFVQKIEAAEKVHFYYNPSELDSFYVAGDVKQMPIRQLLSKAFEDSPFQFAIDSSGNIFIFNNRYTILTESRQLLFDSKNAAKDSVRLSAVNFDEQSVNQKQIASTLENKIFEIGTKSGSQRGNATLAGYVRDARNGEPLAGAVVSVDTPRLHALTDQFGYFSLTLPSGRNNLRVSAVGMKTARRQIALNSSGNLDIDMQDDVPTLRTVIVTSERNSNVRRMHMGVEKLAIKTIKQVPVLLGEADVLRVILTLPGVTSVGEASTGFNVRGGSADQNLVLYNDATVYNPSHFFGFFSAFNPDVIKGVELYKSSIPEKYGGRLSSVLDVSSKDGNKKKIEGVGGIGLLTSKLTIEGPIDKDRTSFIVGGRTTYSNWLLRQIPGDYENSKASFSDLDLHINHIGNAKNSLYLTAYLSNDQFRLNNDTLYKYGNRNLVAKWKHIFNNKLSSTFTTGWDHYQYGVSGDRGTVNGFQLKFRIQQLNFRSDFNYALNSAHNLSFGLTSVRYKLDPGELQRVDEESKVAADRVASEQALESALYFGDQVTLTDNISLNAGIRYSMYNYFGPQKVYRYVDGLPRELTTIRDSTNYSAGKLIQTYHGPEVRLAMRFTLSDSASIKIGYNTLRQYIHLLSNTTSISPTDIWKLSDPNIRPQFGEQFSIGFYRNFRANTIETSIEVYYKRLKNYLDYKSGASLVMNHHIETDVINTKGRSYGVEVLLRKLTGKLNGWLSYTWSRTELQMDDSTAGQLINNGNYYPANFDKPHNLNLIANYRFSHRYSVSLNTIYSTGRPITLPIAIFNLAGSQRLYYSQRNQYRIPDYLRMDFSVNIEGNHKIKKLTHNSWSIGVYNFLARKNPYSIYFTEENGAVKGYQLSIIGTAIPYVTYNFRF